MSPIEPIAIEDNKGIHYAEYYFPGSIENRTGMLFLTIKCVLFVNEPQASHPRYGSIRIFSFKFVVYI